jgi:NADPH-dependent ferric siderophore reductase
MSFARPKQEPPMSEAPRRPQLPAWDLEVVEARQITPRMRRVTFTGSLDGLVWRPGQDFALMIPQADGTFARRHYTIRRLDPAAGRLDIHFVIHHDSPAVRWAHAAAPGDRLVANGPRGRTVLDAEADWHLFTGDETCLPGVFAMLEQLPAGAKAIAFLEVADEDEKQAVETRADLDLTWIVRGGPARPGSAALIEAFETLKAPSGRGAAYVIGETSTVRAQRQGLIARGWDKSRIAAEGYWRPGRVGGHDHVWDAEDLQRRMAQA